jgi:formate hydrogenlyase subunit 4
MSAILHGILNVALVLLLAPFAEGVLRKVTARIQSRRGPPLRQPYYDLLKLLGKEDIESGETPRMQRLAAYLAFASILTVALFVPMGSSPPLGAAGDVLLLVYLLTLYGVSTLLAGFAAGSVYSLLGLSREMMSMMTLEPLLAVSLLVGAIHAGSLRLDAVLDGAVYAGPVPWSGCILLVVGIFAFQAFVGRLPFDVAEAETEIMEGPLVEYSGPKLALFKFAQMAKVYVYAALFVALFAPWGNAASFPLNVLFLQGKIFLLVLFVTVIAATHARYRIDQVVRYYALLLGVSLFVLALAIHGY